MADCLSAAFHASMLRPWPAYRRKEPYTGLSAAFHAIMLRLLNNSEAFMKAVSQCCFSCNYASTVIRPNWAYLLNLSQCCFSYIWAPKYFIDGLPIIPKSQCCFSCTLAHMFIGLTLKDRATSLSAAFHAHRLLPQVSSSGAKQAESQCGFSCT